MRILPLLVLAFATLSAQAAPPVVSNVRASQRAGTHTVDIYYNVSSANSPLTVYVAISADGGTTWNVPVFTTQGAVGPGVTPGNDRHIQWNAGTDWPGQFNSQCRLRITADDGTAPPAPTGMAYIPGGAFQMGDPFNEGGTSELPRHAVYISSMFMDKFDVTRELWLDVYTWALANGYQFDNVGSFNGANHPVQTVNWYDAVKWCNARSERAGLAPCYYTTAAQTTLYRTGQFNPDNSCVKWTANGYRLPTEAEWEKAARGGLAGMRYPWGNSLSCTNANYSGCGPNTTTPVNAYAPNGYGLYDMAGNVWQWCWDWYDGNWYGNYQAILDDTRGPASGSSRLLRGGNWINGAFNLRCAVRDYYLTPSYAYYVVIGFRCVRGL
ncbi:MAG: SUMF1/EgtB/PvdO family nonheme iron enzyme [Verrucomicrobiota bacterium]